MLVKAKWNVKDAGGWHDAGEVFETESDLGNAVEVLGAPKKPAAEQERVPEPKKAPEADEAKAEAPAAEEAPKPRSARRKASR